MSSRPGAAGLLLATALSSFVLVLGFGWMVVSRADVGEPPPTPTVATGLVVGAGELGVDKQPIEPFRGVLVQVRHKPGAARNGSSAPAGPSAAASTDAGSGTELCLSTPDGSWRPAGESWRETPRAGATTYCRDVRSDELTAPVEIELTR